MGLPHPKRVARAGARFAGRAAAAVADRVCRAAVAVAPNRPGWRARLGRVHLRRGDWANAVRTLSAATERRPDRASWQADLGRAHLERREWRPATERYRTAVDLEPGNPNHLAGLVRALTGVGDFAGVLDIGAAVADEPGRYDDGLCAAVAEAAEQWGRWETAVALRADLLRRNERDHARRWRLAQALQQWHRVPFRVDADGAVVAATAPDEAIARARRELAHLVEHDPGRVRAPYALGVLHENLGQYAEAVANYRLALRRLDDVDAPWTHRAVHTWRFRLAYAQARADGAGEHDDPRLRRTVTALGGDASGSAGFFEARVTDQGLQLSGFLAPRVPGPIEVAVDGRALKRLVVNAREATSPFNFEVAHEVIADCAESSTLTVTAAGRPLSTTTGSGTVELRVPDGTGTLGSILDTKSRTLTKKGRWALTDDELARRQDGYLTVYERTRDVLFERYGKRLFLCYGTLLGCHREGGFIPGDDDFDVAYLADSTEPKPLKRELQDTSLALLDEGLDVCFAINGRMIKVGLDDVWIDMTPMWFHKGRAWSFDAHDLRPEQFEPAVPATFHGHDVWVPRDTEAFLVDNYGPDWHIPQSDFRYYRAPADTRVLGRTLLTPSELRGFIAAVDKVRAANPRAGRFAGLGVPAYPGFR